MSRQNYYKSHKVRRRRHYEKDLIISLARLERSLQPEMGCRKVLKRIKPKLAKAGISIGRDRFYETMSEADMLIERKKRSVTTTDSRHNFKTYKNILKDEELTGANQALVSDITYIYTDEGFMYLSLIMDAFSRKIVGYDCSDSLEAEGCLRALTKAIKQLPKGSNTIHHSDRGSQYCCHRYIDKLKRNGLRVSMTEDNHCYENAQAERLNGILKHEYGLKNTFKKKAHVHAAVKQAIELYNTCRPHFALGYRVPEEVHMAA